MAGLVVLDVGWEEVVSAPMVKFLLVVTATELLVTALVVATVAMAAAGAVAAPLAGIMSVAATRREPGQFAAMALDYMSLSK